MRVPALDLQAQYATIRDEIEPVLLEICASQHFVLGYIRFVHFAAGYGMGVGFLMRLYWAFAGALRDAEHALFGDQLRTVGAGHRLALIGRQCDRDVFERRSRNRFGGWYDRRHHEFWRRRNLVD